MHDGPPLRGGAQIVIVFVGEGGSMNHIGGTINVHGVPMCLYVRAMTVVICHSFTLGAIPCISTYFMTHP